MNRWEAILKKSQAIGDKLRARFGRIFELTPESDNPDDWQTLSDGRRVQRQKEGPQ